MNCLIRRGIIPLVVRSATKKDLIRKKLHNICNQNIKVTSTSLDLKRSNIMLYSIRNKSKTKPDADEDNDTIFDDDSSLSKDSKVVKFNATSLRTDMVLKSSLGTSRNKIEQKFYESKIRVNGKKILKKSISIKEGDEIDIIKSVSPNNPDHLYVIRVEILNLGVKDDNITVTARRFKSLLIENYESDPYKGSSSDS